MSRRRLPLVALISGRGSNLQSIIDAAGDDDLPVEIRAVLSNEPDAYGLKRARRAGIETRVVNHRDYESRHDFDAALVNVIDGFEPGLVVLAGFMRILTADFVNHYHGRLMNIHPSLLPDFPGVDTHQRALDAGVKEHGASVHFVTPELDGGPVIIQARVPVKKGDDADALAARVLEKEHLIYPRAIKWFAEGRLEIDDKRVLLDGKPSLDQR
ncbi:MAG: phosphoribosylglycinamide formyltransferase [Gammaproteobacteria bacterium]|nr:phosphoribosylglycinamide formyltransferase [Gammaproteobacteria bacterium]MDH3412673.1 phosphoribosylglycinamide formyltransferase [Gammaproteobacteria bacterium]